MAVKMHTFFFLPPCKSTFTCVCIYVAGCVVVEVACCLVVVVIFHFHLSMLHCCLPRWNGMCLVSMPWQTLSVVMTIQHPWEESRRVIYFILVATA